jgi:hypothetical protein
MVKVNGKRYTAAPRPHLAYSRTAFAPRDSETEHAIFHAVWTPGSITHRRRQCTARIEHHRGRRALVGAPRSHLRHVQKDTLGHLRNPCYGEEKTIQGKKMSMQKDTLGHLRNPCYSEFVIGTPCITRLYGCRVIPWLTERMSSPLLMGVGFTEDIEESLHCPWEMLHVSLHVMLHMYGKGSPGIYR